LRESLLKKDEDFLLFSPSRQIWEKHIGKGNDKMIQAFAKFLKLFPHSRWVLSEWGPDIDKSKNLIKSFKIYDNITWIKPVPKNQLIEYYNASDVVLDQAELGVFGTSSPEAMACGKPLITSWAGKDGTNKEDFITCFKEAPPALHGWYIDEIYSNLIKLAKDKEYRLELGKKSREWVIKTHDPVLVAKMHLEILKEIIL